MFYVILSIVSFVCVILAAVCGYLLAIVKNRQIVTKPEPAARPVPSPVTIDFSPVARPVDAAPVVIDTPKPEPKTTPKNSATEKPAPVQRPVSSPVPTAKPEPKKRVNNTPVKADVQAVLDTITNSPISDTLRKEAANFKMIFTIDAVKKANVSWFMPDNNHILMEARDLQGRVWSQKEDIKNGGRRVTCTENGQTTIFKSVGALLAYLSGQITLEEASRGKAKTEKAENPAPVVNEPAPVPSPEPAAPVTPKKGRKNTPKNNPVNNTPAPVENPAPVAETKPEPAPVANEPKNDTPAPVKKADVLDAIKVKIGEGCTLAKPIACTIGKKASSIVSVSIDNDTLYFTADEKARKASDVYFATKTCAEILDNMAAAKPEPKNDVQPVSDEARYAQNTAEGIIKTCDNKNVQAVTFTDSIATEFTQPKTGKKVKAEIVGLRRDSKGNIIVCGEREDGKMIAIELAKGANVFNLGTLRTIGKQINEGLAGKKAANARIEKMASVA